MAYATRQRPPARRDRRPTDPTNHPSGGRGRRRGQHSTSRQNPALRPLLRAQRHAPARTNGRTRDRYRAQGAGRIGRARQPHNTADRRGRYFASAPCGRRGYCAPYRGHHLVPQRLSTAPRGAKSRGRERPIGARERPKGAAVRPALYYLILGHYYVTTL